MAQGRRGHGEGSIYERRVDGKLVGYVAQVSGGWQGGKRVRKAVSGSTKAEVREKLRALQRDAETGTLRAGRTPTVGEWLTTWLELQESGRTIRPLTLKRYSAIVRTHLAPGLGQHRIDRLTDTDVQRFLNSLDRHPRTVRHVRAVLRTSLNRAIKSGYLSRNVAALTDPPRIPSVPGRFLTVTEANAVLVAAKGERLEALYHVALGLGLRIGEALGLEWDHVDLAGGRLSVVLNLQRVNGKLQLVETKTEKSRRTLAIPAPVLAQLAAHRLRQNDERWQAGTYWQESGLVFTTTLGTPLDASDVSRGFQAFLSRHSLPKVRFHDLRHSCASVLLSLGVGPKVVQEILGHSNIATTMNTYAHVMPEQFMEAAEAMGRALGS